MEVEAPATGRLHHILASVGQSVAVGAPVAFLYAEGEAVGASPVPVASPSAPQPEAAKAERAAAQPAAPKAEPVSEPDGLRATPVARRLARDAAIALETLIGSGPRQRIQKQDVERELPRLKTPAAAPAPVPVAPAPVAQMPAPVVAQAGALSVKTRPGTGTPLVLIHGFAADSAGWAPLERALPRDLPLIRVDLPSHGRSPRRAIRDFGELLRSMVQVFDAHVDGPVHVLGHSLGGALALGLTDIRPCCDAVAQRSRPAGRAG